MRFFDDADESEKLIEVTANEVRCSEDVPEKFHLFRVFDFSRIPRVYILTGSLRTNCRLEATVFRATT